MSLVCCMFCEELHFVYAMLVSTWSPICHSVWWPGPRDTCPGHLSEFGAILVPVIARKCCALFSPSENSRLAAEVYKDMPETSFTRTISNPEVVMKRRRQQKLERRMQEFRSSDGLPDSGTHTRPTPLGTGPCVAAAPLVCLQYVEICLVTRFPPVGLFFPLIFAFWKIIYERRERYNEFLCLITLLP